MAGLAAIAGCAPAESRPLGLFAAASLTDVLSPLVARFDAGRQPRSRTVFAGTGEIARQVLVGAPADVVALADEAWMDRLQAEAAVRAESRVVLVTNSLVVIAPADRSDRPFRWQGRIAIGDPSSVPAGRYAQQMMQSLGVWHASEPGLVTASDVRAVRGFVARGEVDLGVVYRSDALGFDDVRVVFVPPAEAQPDIVYPAALTTDALPQAADLMRFLRSAEASAAFAAHGFGPSR